MVDRYEEAYQGTGPLVAAGKEQSNISSVNEAYDECNGEERKQLTAALSRPLPQT